MVTFVKQETMSIGGTPVAIGLTEDDMVFLGSPPALAKLENPRQAVSDEPEDAEKTWAAVRQLTAALNRDAGYHLHRSDRHGHLKKYVELSLLSRHDQPRTFFELDHMEMRRSRCIGGQSKRPGIWQGFRRVGSLMAAGQRRSGRAKTNGTL